jgi:ribonuclease HI
MPSYAVKRGRVPGLYGDWSACRVQVEGYPSCDFRKFATRAEAVDWLGYDPKAPAKMTPRGNTQSACESLNECQLTVGAAVFSGKGHWPARAGWAIYQDEHSPFNEYGRVLGDISVTTAFLRASLFAVLQGLQTLPKGVKVEFLLGSVVAVRYLTVLYVKWQETDYRNAKNKPVANGDLVRACIDLAQEKGIQMKVTHQPLSARVPSSSIADLCAHKGAWKETTEDWEYLADSEAESTTDGGFTDTDINSDTTTTAQRLVGLSL